MAEYSAQSYDYTGSLSNLFEPDVMLPSQFLSDSCRGVEGGERKLMAALLSDGIEAYIQQSLTRVGKPTKTVDACEWVDTQDYSYVFSFDVVCECLGIDPDYLRLGLNRYVEAIQRDRKEGSAPKKTWKKIRRPRK